MRFPMFSGKSSSFEQPDRVRVLIFFIIQMAFGILRSSLQSIKFNEVRLDKCLNDDGSSLMAVLFTSSSFKPMRFPKFFGNLSSVEQPERVSAFRFVILQMVSGRLKRSLQSLRFNEVRLVKRTTDDGSSLIAIPITSSFSRYLRFPRFVGNFLSVEQPDRVSIFRDVKRQMELGRLKRDLQSLRLNRVRLVKCFIDNSSPSIAVPTKTRCGKCDIFPTIFGKFFNLKQP